MSLSEILQQKHSPRNQVLAFLLSGFLLAVIVSTIVLASVPPVDRDALTHHLFVPKLYLQHGGIYEIPEISFSYYPMNLDLLYLIPLYFGNDIVPKYIHFFFALLTAGIIYRYLKKNTGTPYGLLGALLFLSIPIIVKLSITVYVDLGVVFFTTASLLLLFHWARKGFQVRFLIFAGLCCGLAAGTKYNGLISIFILTLFVPIIYQQSVTKEKQSNSKALLYGVLFAAATLIAYSPWLIRNYAWTGNPIFPLHNTFFQQTKTSDIDKVAESNEITDPSQQLTGQGSGAFTSRKILYNEQWWQALLLPIRFFYEGQDDNPQFFDGKLNPFLLLLPALAFLIKSPNAQQRREKNFLLFFAVLYFFLTFFQQALRIRYIVPIVPPLVILSMYGLRGLSNRLFEMSNRTNLQKSIFLLVITGIPCLMLWFNTKYIANQFPLVNPLPFLQGQISRDEYITTYRPEFPAIQFANTYLDKGSKVLCLFLGNRGYYMDFQPVFEQPFNSSGLFSQFFKMNKQERDILDLMQQNGITHILLRDDLTKSWFQQLNDNDKSLILPVFQKMSKPLLRKNGHTFFSIFD